LCLAFFWDLLDTADLETAMAVRPCEGSNPAIQSRISLNAKRRTKKKEKKEKKKAKNGKNDLSRRK